MQQGLQPVQVVPDALRSGGTGWVPLAHLRSRCATWWPLRPPTSGSSAQQRHLAGNLESTPGDLGRVFFLNSRLREAENAQEPRGPVLLRL